MDILGRITQLRLERHWSEYQLAERSGVAQSTISTWYNKKMTPTVASLEKLCDAFGISLSRFFDLGEQVSLSQEQRRLLERWERLGKEQKQALLNLMDTMVS